MPSDPIKAQAARTLKRRIARDLKKGILKGLRSAVQEVETMTKDLQAEIQITEAQYRREMFDELGRLAQRAIVEAYETEVEGREGAASAEHYRKGGYKQRMAGGIMHDALESPKFFQVTSNGLAFGDLNVLNQAAAQWHRLEAGAGARGGGGGGGGFTVDLGDSSTVLSYNDAPSPGFSMPPGMFRNPGSGRIIGRDPGRRGMDMFSPGMVSGSGGNMGSSAHASAVGLSKGRAKAQRQQYSQGWIPTGGIQGKHFLEAGLEDLAKRIPPAYRQYAMDLISGSLRRVAQKRNRTKVGVRVGTEGIRLTMP